MVNKIIAINFIFIAFIFSLPNSAFSKDETPAKTETTITVPSEDCPTIKKALENAKTGDTIYVKPGSYKESDLKLKNGIRFYGAGADKTEIILDRLTLCSQSGRGNLLSNIAIEGVSIKIKGGALYIDFAKDIIIRKCIITGTGGGIYVLRSNNIEIVNCTIADLRGGITVGYLPVGLTIRNSIISDCGRTGILISSETERKTIDYETGKVMEPETKDAGKLSLSLFYNNIWGHSYNNFYDTTAEANSRSKIPGENNISKDPKFVDVSKGDYHLRSDSPCIRAGDPDKKYNNPDGTRNDIGALPFGH